MTVKFLDSFDHYTTAYLGYKYHTVGTIADSSIEISAGTGRIDTDSIHLIGSGAYGSAYVRRTIGPTQTFSMGAAMKIGTQVVGWPCFNAVDDATVQLRMRINYDGTISVLRGTETVIGTSEYALIHNAYYYVEFAGSIGGSGSYSVRVGEIEILSDSGVLTQVTANGYLTALGLMAQGESIEVWFDDLYMTDDNTQFLGDIHVEALLPEADGSMSEWTPEGETYNYECVNQNPPDGDTTYNYTDEVDTPKTDLFDMDDMAIVSGDVMAIQFVMFQRKDNADAVLVEPTLKIDSTVYNLDPVSVTETYKFDLEVLEENPDTEAPFTVSEVNSTEFGYTRPS
jgi:hypothetical protein